MSGCVLPVVDDSNEIPPRSEEELLRAIASGDRAAFAELYDRTAPWLTARLRRRCTDPALVEEILQDTFLTVWRCADGFTGSGAAVGWVWTIDCNRVVHLSRWTLPRPASTDDSDRWLPSSPSAEDQALTDRYEPREESALAGLSPQLRKVLQATVLDGISVRHGRDVGPRHRRLADIPESTVKTRAFRTRLQMRKVLS